MEISFELNFSKSKILKFIQSLLMLLMRFINFEKFGQSILI